MAYRIDYSESIWDWRKRRKRILQLLLLALMSGVAWCVYDGYKTYNEPTLNMRLAEYETVVRPIEEMSDAWDEAAKEYAAMVRYYRLVWAANPTNFLVAMAASDAPRLRRGFLPRCWTLTTGGKCQLDGRYVFETGDKAEQVKGLEDEVIRSVTSVVQVVDGKVDVHGVQHENLLDVDELNVTVEFSFPDVMSFPTKERSLAGCVKEIVEMRKKVQKTKLVDAKAAKGTPSTAQDIMMAYLPVGRDKPGFPEFANVLNVSGWFDRADQFVKRNNIGGDVEARKRLKAKWNEVGDARYPWARFRVLDNLELVNRTKALTSVADGVKRFKGFLDKRKVDGKKKLEPFVAAYAHNDVFNKPLVESDLKDKVALSSGISSVRVTFKDEDKVEPAILVRADEKFSFTWIRWTLVVGDGARKDGDSEKSHGKSNAAESITLGKLADCARRALTLGPGYAIDKMKISFSEDGSVSGAVLEGLLPVKKVEPVGRK